MCDLYGLNDNSDFKSLHVLPALLAKVHQAKQKDLPEVSIWGSGTPMREFVYSDDMARACVSLLEQQGDVYEDLFDDTEPPLLNIGTGGDILHP